MSKEIIFRIDISKNSKKGFVTCCSILNETRYVEYNPIHNEYENGKIIISSVPFGNEITKEESIITSIEQILIDSSIKNIYRKLKKINNEEIRDLRFSIYYSDNMKEYIGMIKKEIKSNKYIDIELKYKLVEDMAIQEAQVINDYLNKRN